jgi:hypothetical protein
MKVVGVSFIRFFVRFQKVLSIKTFKENMHIILKKLKICEKAMDIAVEVYEISLYQTIMKSLILIHQIKNYYCFYIMC